MFARVALLAAAAACCVFSLAVHADDSLVVQTASGSVQGYLSAFGDYSVRAWRGIPYAQPTSGANRFQAPKAAVPWSTVKQTTVSGHGCPQICSLPTGLCPASQSEDCLYLNVFSPTYTDSSDLLPVMFFIHGGNFRQGEGSSSMYDPTVMVNTTQVVVVTINYRLGALGFFFQGASTANNGMLDQQMALQWVATNIEAFGGDPTQVTIFGQSAGATSVASHLQNPTSLKLFRSAILHSLPLGIPVRNPAEAKALNADFATDANCQIDDLACLQALDIPTVLAAQSKSANAVGPDLSHLLEIAQAWEPTLQMTSFNIGQPLDQFFQSYGQTAAANVPLMIGTTSQEAYIFIYELVNSTMGWVAAAALEAVILGGDSVGPLGTFYPLAAGQDNRVPISNMGTDELFVCPARNATDGILSGGGNVRLFVFDHLSQDSEAGWGPHYPICWTKVCHGSDVPYAFNAALPAGRDFTPPEQALAFNMSVYWTNFAKSGDPNKGIDISPEWPTVGGTRETMLFSTTQGGVIQNYHGPACDYLDTLGYEH